jgi:hypothetical protein
MLFCFAEEEVQRGFSSSILAWRKACFKSQRLHTTNQQEKRRGRNSSSSSSREKVLKKKSAHHRE